MTIKDIIQPLEIIAPPVLQEGYDNAGLITGDADWQCTGAMISLDATEAVIQEAISKKCNLVIAHHPIVFSGMKKINGKNYVEKAVIKAIKNDVAIYAIHTNLDNVSQGVNGKIADILGLINRRVLSPKKNILQKLAVYVPVDETEKLRKALFDAGAGDIGNYSECSFGMEGTGTFKPGAATNPTIGAAGGVREHVRETRLEVIFPQWLQKKIISAMKSAHPYEEVAYEITALENEFAEAGSGLIGELPESTEEQDFLKTIKEKFNVKVIKHTAFTGRAVRKVAICGGAGSFLTGAAIAAGADIFITSDVKYHEFFDADGRLLLADIGHYESEQYTIDLIADVLHQKFPNFAVLKSGVITNPVFTF